MASGLSEPAPSPPPLATTPDPPGSPKRKKSKSKKQPATCQKREKVSWSVADDELAAIDSLLELVPVVLAVAATVSHLGF